MRLSRDDILKAEDIATEEVAVPEWGGTVLVRGLTGRQRDEFEAGMLEQRGKRMVPNMVNIRAKIVSWCVVDEDGRRLFTATDVEDLGGKSAAAIDRVYEVAARLSGLKDEDVEGLVENFGGPNGASSSSASPATSKRPRSARS